MKWKRDRTFEISLPLPESLVRDIDARRGLSTRAAYILLLLDRALEMPASTDSRSLSLRRTLRLTRTGIWVY